jgi:hypothetical protein
MCNVDLGLLVVTDHESGNRPPYKADEVTFCIITQSPSNLHQQQYVGYYSPETRTIINLSCSLCSAYSCATFEFLVSDSSHRTNKPLGITPRWLSRSHHLTVGAPGRGIASSSCSLMPVRSGDLFGDDMKDICVATCSPPLSDLIASDDNHP